MLCQVVGLGEVGVCYSFKTLNTICVRTQLAVGVQRCPRALVPDKGADNHIKPCKRGARDSEFLAVTLKMNQFT